MKAILYNHYGAADVLYAGEVNKPVPQNNEILIKVHFSTVTTGDVNIRGFVFVPKGFKFIARLMFGYNKPKKQILGVEFSGIVEAAGGSVKHFKPGDKVFGIDGSGMGAYADYKCFNEDGAVLIIPQNLSLEEAAAIPFGGLTAYFFLKEKADIKSGQKALIIGASGGVGTAAIQVAKYYGAEVTGVCSTGNLDLVRSIGADKTIDYTREDYGKSSTTYDIILDTTGTVTYPGVKNILSKNGKLLLVAAGLPQFLLMFRSSLFGGPKVIAGGGASNEKKEYLEALKKMAEEGKYKPVIDKLFDFDETADAHAYVDTGRKRGNVVIRINI